MKKVFGILAVVMLSLGMFSCEANNDEVAYDADAVNGMHSPTDERE